MTSEKEQPEEEEKGNLWTSKKEEKSAALRALESSEFDEQRLRDVEIDESGLQERLKPFNAKVDRESLDKSLD